MYFNYRRSCNLEKKVTVTIPPPTQQIHQRTSQQHPSSPTAPYYSYNNNNNNYNNSNTETAIRNSNIISNNNSGKMTTTTMDSDVVGPTDAGVVGGGGSTDLVDVNIQYDPTITTRTTTTTTTPTAADSVISKNPSGLCGTSSNLMNSIVGAGIIGIPYALRQSGIVVGTFLLVLVAYLTDKSLRMMMDCALFHPKLRKCGIYTFEELIQIPFGRIGYQFILGSMFIMAYGAMIAYLIIIKDTIPKVFGYTNNSFVEKELIMTISSIVIILPLALLRDISMLSFTSAISVAADVALVVIIVVFSPVASTIDEYDGNGLIGIIQDFWISPQLFIGLGVLSTAMACQHSAFLISGSLSNITPHRWSIVTFRSISTATIMTLLLGIFGFLGYLSQTQGNVLNNFPEQSVAINSGRGLLGLTMYLTYPMESLVARHVIIQLFYQGNMDNTTINSNTGEIIPEQKYWCCGLIGRRHFVTIVLFICTLIPALLVDDLGPVLSITGSLGASCIAYIAPGIVYIGVNGGHFLQWVEGKAPEDIDSTDEAMKETELPIVGDATARMSTSSLSYQSSSPTANENRRNRTRRPFWWCLVGMPIWMAIAKRGERGTREYVGNFERQHTNSTNSNNDDPSSSTNIVQPKYRDYYVSIFMILFGLLAVVCGVISNIYVELHNIFFTPH